MPVLWVLITTSIDDTYVGLQYARIQQQGFVAYLLMHDPNSTLPAATYAKSLLAL